MKDWNEALNKGVAIRAYADQAKPWSGNGKVIPLAPERRLIIPSRDFVKNYVAPKYIVEGILQQNRLYSLTGKTGDGKTALQLYLAQLWALGVPLGARDVEKCRVLYLAGENPDDVRARWLAMSDELEFDPNTINVHFVEGVFSVSEQYQRVVEETKAIGGFGAIIVDTSAAFFEGDEENDNVQLLAHARMLRELTRIDGTPSVIAGCHPIKSGENLVPRGGGSYLAEVDGNLTCRKVSDTIIEVHWSGKFRGPCFDPIMFKLVPITSERVKDAKGRLVPSVMARLADDTTVEDVANELADDQEQVMLCLDSTPGMSQAKTAEALGWVSKYGPDKAKVNRALKQLEKHRLAEKDMRDKYALTEKGKAEATKLRKMT